MQSNKGKKITAEDVISKLKDDGDFDTLRLKIIRKLKENENLRNSIISAVKQSAALNRSGAENLKPRQLSDAIHEEIGSKVMGQISDGLWEVIRSSDGMKNEITETVQCVYNKLANPKGNEVDENLSPDGKEPNGSLSPSRDGITSDDELAVPPGFPACDHLQTKVSQDEHKDSLRLSPCDQQQSNDGQEVHKVSPSQEEQPCEVVVEPPLEVPNAQMNGPPGFSTAFVDRKRKNDGSDEDPDVPPGFG